jgi:hypothetical protein
MSDETTAKGTLPSSIRVMTVCRRSWNRTQPKSAEVEDPPDAYGFEDKDNLWHFLNENRFNDYGV